MTRECNAETWTHLPSWLRTSHAPTILQTANPPVKRYVSYFEDKNVAFDGIIHLRQVFSKRVLCGCRQNRELAVCGGVRKNGLKQLILIRRGNGHWRPVLGRVYLSENVRHAPELPLTGPVL